MDKAYSLSWDGTHLVDVDKDAWLMTKFPEWESTRPALLREYEIPNPVEFGAFFDVIRKTDFPITDVTWPIMSKRMLETLSTIKDFSKKLFPIRMIDCEIVGFEEGEDIISGEVNDDFVMVQLLEHNNFFDWERSIYTKNPRKEDKVRRIEKLVLKEPPSGFPSLFRISAKPSLLFVSNFAKEALENIEAKGIVLSPIDIS